MGVWTDEVTAMVKAEWRKGTSANVCARMANARFGCGLSRNAVVGKMFRLKVAHPGRVDELRCPTAASRRAMDKAARKAERERRALERARMTEAQREADRIARERAEQARKLPWLPLSGSTPRPLEEHTACQCLWPIGSFPNFTFCCEPVQDGKSYCRTHQRMSIARDQPRRLTARDAAWVSREFRRAA